MAEGFLADGHVGFDTFQEAMLAHADQRKVAARAPQDWNRWLQEAYAIAKAGPFPDAPDGKG